MRTLRHVSGMFRNAISVAQTVFSQDRTLPEEALLHLKAFYYQRLKEHFS